MTEAARAGERRGDTLIEDITYAGAGRIHRRGLPDHAVEHGVAGGPERP
jgi:hypothetical protein